MASTLSGPAESKLLSLKVTPTVPSAPVTRVSDWRTAVPTCTGRRLPSRSRCTAPAVTLTSPMSLPQAAAANPIRHTAIVQRMVFPHSPFKKDSIMPRKDNVQRDKFPLDNVSLPFVRTARNQCLPGGFLRHGGDRAPAMPAPEPGAGGAFHQHGAARPLRRLRRSGVDDAFSG